MSSDIFAVNRHNSTGSVVRVCSGHVLCWAGTVYSYVYAGQDLGGVGKVLGLLVPKPRYCGHMLTAAVSTSSSHGSISILFRGAWDMMDGWMDDGWMMDGWMGVRSNRNC